MQNHHHQILSFANFALDLTRGCLWGPDEKEIKLRPKSFEVLRHLVENSGRLISKEELITRVWGETAVTDDSLVQCMTDVRRALGDARRFIKTVPRRGYIFEVEAVTQTSDGRGSVSVDEIEKEEETATRDELPARHAAQTMPPQVSMKRHALLLFAPLSLILIATAYIAIYHNYLTTSQSGAGVKEAVPIRSIAVLPLENLSGDPEQEYFADGMTESIISNLAHIQALRVISRTSVMRYKAVNKSLPQIARELNVDAVVEGSVRRSGGRVLVTAKLIRAATDSALWSAEYEQNLKDVLRIESELARTVAEEIRVQITPQERTRLASARTIDPQTHEAFLLGRYHMRRGDDSGFKQAIDYFQRAIEISPDYAAAYAGLADAWLQRSAFRPQEVETPARAAALKAIALDEKTAEAHMSLATIKLEYDWDWAGSEQDCRRALEIEPGSAEAHVRYGVLLMELGRYDKAIREGQIAVTLDPLSSRTESALGWFLFRAHKYEEALPHLNRAVELEPRSGLGNYRLGIQYATLGRHEDAIATFKKVGNWMGKENLQAAIAHVYALQGRRREALQMITAVRAKANPYGIVRVYDALGDKNEAFRILDKAVEEHRVRAVRDDPLFENLHADPRWEQLLHRMNLPSADPAGQ